MENVAGKILNSVKAMVPGKFTTEPATQATHPHVDWGAYRKVRETAGALGLQHLGDVDPTSVYLDPKIMKRAVLSMYVSDDGTIVVGHYRIALRWTLTGILARFMGGLGDMFDVGTSFGGGQGVTIETSTAEASGVWSRPDFVLRETLPRGTPLEQALQRHRARVNEYRAQHRDARPTVVHTLNDVVSISNTLEQRKLAWRRSLGWATREELERVTKLTGSTFDQFYEAFLKVARENP